jgi:hypothetical protein
VGLKQPPLVLLARTRTGQGKERRRSGEGAEKELRRSGEGAEKERRRSGEGAEQARNRRGAGAKKERNRRGAGAEKDRSHPNWKAQRRALCWQAGWVGSLLHDGSLPGDATACSASRKDRDSDSESLRR